MRRITWFLAALIATNAFGAGLSDDEIRQAYARSYGYEHTQNQRDAIKALSAVEEAYPKAYTINLRLGWLHYLNGSYANALAHYETAINALPQSVEAKLGYTLPLLAQSRYQDVEAVARQILAIDPANFYGNLRLAVALRLQGKFDPAAKVAGAMLVLYPTDVGYLTELGLDLAGLKETAAARKIFADVLTLDPENPTARQRLAK